MFENNETIQDISSLISMVNIYYSQHACIFTLGILAYLISSLTFINTNNRSEIKLTCINFEPKQNQTKEITMTCPLSTIYNFSWQELTVKMKATKVPGKIF
jgi:hypothetical protein